jgi:hypothetical protein
MVEYQVMSREFHDAAGHTDGYATAPTPALRLTAGTPLAWWCNTQ